MNPIAKVLDNSDLNNIIQSFLRCKWCSRVPTNFYPNIRDWDLLTDGVCIHCLRKKYDAYF